MSSNDFVDEDTYDLILTLFLQNSIKNQIVVDSRRVIGATKDAKKFIDGKYWLKFDRFGNLIFMDVKDDEF